MSFKFYTKSVLCFLTVDVVDLGVPKLNRTELEIACEDFSNIIGNFQDGVLYKGTLSSGVEIAVVSFSVASAKDWSRLMETQFREKVMCFLSMSLMGLLRASIISTWGNCT